MDQSVKVRECFACFQEEPILKELLASLHEKYRSLGYPGGRITISGISPENREILEGFMGKNFHGQDNVCITAAGVEKALRQSKYEGVTLKELLEYLSVGGLSSKKEDKENYLKKRSDFYDCLAEKYAGEPVEKWLLCSDVCEKFLNRRYKEEKEKLSMILVAVMKALSQLPVYRREYEYLSVFSAKITADPHFFDRGGTAFELLIHGIRFLETLHEKTAFSLVDETDWAADFKNNSEKADNALRQEYLYAGGLLVDEISNSVHVCGILACDKSGEIHAGIKGFYDREEPMELTLFTVSRLDKIRAAGGLVYAVENPSVYRYLVDKLYNKASAVCINGQPNLTVLLLLDKLTQGGAIIYYAGDFDPEGLLIADRLKRRYKDSLVFWKMDLKYYEKAISDKELSTRRLSMLDKLEDLQLLAVAQMMKIKKLAGYQERILEEYKILK